MTRALAFLPLLLAACGTDAGDDTVDTDDTTDTDVELPPQEQPLTVAPDGDLTCVTPAATFDAVTWAMAQAPNAGTDSVDVDILVQDFEQEEPRAGRNVSLWYSDVAEGPADTTGSVDDGGHVTLSAPACTPFSYLTKEPAGLDEAKETYKAHMVFGPAQTDAEFQSVSIDTYRLIPTVLGLSVESTKGIIAGTVYDCGRDPATLSSDENNKVGNARVRLTSCPSADAEASECSGAVTGPFVKYFVDNFPSRDKGFTSEDGLWGFFNVPEGTYRIEAYGLIDGEEKVFGATIVTVYADSINIANIWAGYPDGVKYPSTCTVLPD